MRVSPAVRSAQPLGQLGQIVVLAGPNISSKPTLLRSGKSLAEKACQPFASTTHRGLTQVLALMGRKLAITLLSLAIYGCASMPASEAEVVGCYQAYDQSIYTQLKICLAPDRTYTADLRGDIGSWGQASGQWSYAAGAVTFIPEHETERLHGFIRSALTSTRSGGKLVPLGATGKPVWDALAKYANER